MVRNESVSGRITQRHELRCDLSESVYNRLSGGKRSREESRSVVRLTKPQVRRRE